MPIDLAEDKSAKIAKNLLFSKQETTKSLLVSQPANPVFKPESDGFQAPLQPCFGKQSKLGCIRHTNTLMLYTGRRNSFYSFK